MSAWSDDACRGYVLSAMLAAGINRSVMNKVLASLEFQLSTLSVEEAAALGGGGREDHTRAG